MQQTRTIVTSQEFETNIMYVTGGMLTAARAVVTATIKEGYQLESLKETLRSNIFSLEDADIEHAPDGLVDLEHEVLPKTLIIKVKRSKNIARKDCLMCSIGEHVSTDIMQVTIELAAESDITGLIAMPVIFVQRQGIQNSYYARALLTDVKMNTIACSKMVFLRGFNGISHPNPEYYFHDAQVVHLPRGYSDLRAFALYIDKYGYMDDMLIEAFPKSEVEGAEVNA